MPAGQPHPGAPCSGGQRIWRVGESRKTRGTRPPGPKSAVPACPPLIGCYVTPARRGACAATAVCVRADARRGGGEDGGDGRGRGGGRYEAGAERAEEASVRAVRSQRNIVGVSSRGLAREVGPGRTCCAGPGRGDARPFTLHFCFLPGRGRSGDGGCRGSVPGLGRCGKRQQLAGEDSLVLECVVGRRCLGTSGWLCQAPRPRSRNPEKPGS